MSAVSLTFPNSDSFSLNSASVAASNLVEISSCGISVLFSVMSLRISSESSFPVAMSIFPGLEFVMETLAAAVLSPIVIPVTVAVPLTTTLKFSALIVPASTETTDVHGAHEIGQRGGFGRTVVRKVPDS